MKMYFTCQAPEEVHLRLTWVNQIPQQTWVISSDRVFCDSQNFGPWFSISTPKFIKLAFSFLVTSDAENPSENPALTFHTWLLSAPGLKNLLSICSDHELRCCLSSLHAIVQKFRQVRNSIQGSSNLTMTLQHEGKYTFLNLYPTEVYSKLVVVYKELFNVQLCLLMEQGFEQQPWAV